MRTRLYTWPEAGATFTAADPDGISLSQSTAGAANLTITGIEASGGSWTPTVPRFALITSVSSDESGKTFTFTGTDRNGDPLTEAIAGPTAAGTVATTQNWGSITQIAVSAALTANVIVGTNAAADTKVIPLDRYASDISYDVHLSAGASLTWNWQYTLEDPRGSGYTAPDGQDAKWYNDSGTQTGDLSRTSDGPLSACRVEITGYTSGILSMNLNTANR